MREKKKALPRKRSAGGKRNPADLSTVRLKWLYGESQGKDKIIEDVLRERGFNSKQLAEVEWRHSQRKGLREATKARAIHRKKRKAKRRKKLKRQRAWWAEKRRREQIREVAQVKAGVIVPAETLDASTPDAPVCERSPQ